MCIRDRPQVSYFGGCGEIRHSRISPRRQADLEAPSRRRHIDTTIADRGRPRVVPASGRPKRAVQHDEEHDRDTRGARDVPGPWAEEAKDGPVTRGAAQE